MDDERTHPEEPAEGGDEEVPNSGRTPHTEEPAEGAEKGTGIDPDERVTGV